MGNPISVILSGGVAQRRRSRRISRSTERRWGREIPAKPEEILRLSHFVRSLRMTDVGVLEEAELRVKSWMLCELIPNTYFPA